VLFLLLLRILGTEYKGLMIGIRTYSKEIVAYIHMIRETTIHYTSYRCIQFSSGLWLSSVSHSILFSCFTVPFAPFPFLQRVTGRSLEFGDLAFESMSDKVTDTSQACAFVFVYSKFDCLSCFVFRMDASKAFSGVVR
jgi:hypothetical protein